MKNALKFTDHTLADGRIHSTRIQRVDDETSEVGEVFFDKTMNDGHHGPDYDLPYETRHDWPTVHGQNIEMSNAPALEGVCLWTVGMNGVDNHTALLVPALHLVPDSQIKAREGQAMYAALLLSILAKRGVLPPPNILERAWEESQKILAQRPVLVTVPPTPLDAFGFHQALMVALSVSMAAAIVDMEDDHNYGGMDPLPSGDQ